MKILTLHSDYLKFKPTKRAISTAEDAEKVERLIKECLVVFISAEKRDESVIDSVAKRLVEEVKKIVEQVKTEKIVLYPYAHLSSDLANPKNALEIIKKSEILLKKEGYDVLRAPFGWYKQFEVRCKGHPLSELSREFSSEERKEPEVKKERKTGSEFCRFVLIDKKGKDYEITLENWKKSVVWKNKEQEYKRLQIFVRNELEGAKEKETPRHIGYMKNLELVDYCPESDIGHMKWYPKGLLIKDLILAYQEKLARDYGAFKIQNPLLYRLSVPAIQQLLGEFRERDYSWQEGNEKLILRFASDPGAFPYMQKVNFSYKNMPIKEYEEAICFRKEQKGEVRGLRRVRNFLMTDLHSFCKDEKQVKEEFMKLCIVCKQLMNEIIAKGRWVLGWEGTVDFYEKNKEWLLKLIKDLGVPSFFKLMKERSHYYDMKNEFQSIEADEANTQISTVQIDSTNGKRFNISYVDDDGKKKPCLIIHCSTFGSIERTFCAILENIAIDEKEGKKPMLPLWLSPTQVRLIPVSIDKHLKFCLKLADDLEKNQIRVDIDDDVQTVGKRILKAEEEWIPHILVIGDKEVKAKKLVDRNRELNKQADISKEKLIKSIRDKTKDMPFKPLPLPKLLSKRPIFVG